MMTEYQHFREEFPPPHLKCGLVVFNPQSLYKVRCNVCNNFVSLNTFRNHHIKHLLVNAKNKCTEEEKMIVQSTKYLDEIKDELSENEIERNETKKTRRWSTEKLFMPEFFQVELTNVNEEVSEEHLDSNSPEEAFEIDDTEEAAMTQEMLEDNNESVEWDDEESDEQLNNNEEDESEWDIENDDSDANDTNEINHIDIDVVPSGSTSKKFPCPQCDKQYMSKHVLKKHLRQWHNPESPLFKCKECGEEFKDEHLFELHEYKHTGYYCKICNNNRNYSSMSALKRHHKVHGEKKFKCDECDAKFISIFELQFHSIKHTGVRKMMCELCGKPCKDRWNLEQHLLRHTGERPIACPHCDKRFFNSIALKHHKSVHSNERPFTCDVCGSAFKRKYSLRVHSRSHSIEPLTVECKVCKRMFATEGGLRSHMSTHDTVYGLGYPASGTILTNKSSKCSQKNE